MSKKPRIKAFHQAGHAVIARILGVEVIRAAMSPTSDDNLDDVMTRSAAWLARDVTDISAKVLAFEADAKVALAGTVAQRRSYPGSDAEDEIEQDVENAKSAACVVSLLMSGELLPDVPDGDRMPIDAALVEDPEATLDRLWRETVVLVTEQWPAIERVAQALERRDHLDQTEIDRLIAEAGPAPA